MSDIISKIHDDMEEYERLCQDNGVEPKYTRDAYGNLILDCYGSHAKQLESKKTND